jgi:hypothetical protein
VVSSLISLLFPGAQVGMNFYKEIIESAKSGNSEDLKI